MLAKTAFADALARRQPLLIDGGLATQLEAQGCDISNALWSAALLQSDPDAIVAAHRAYLDAGAECIATASYQASRDGFARRGLTPAQGDELLRLSVSLAMRAREEFLAATPATGGLPLVAASLGPWGAAQHDGSEYTGAYEVGAGDLAAFHEQRLRVLDATAADVLALETIPNRGEAEALVELLRHCNTPAWVSFCCRDGRHISDGTPVENVASLYRDHATVVAVGINCTSPQFVPELVRRVATAAPGKAVIAYPNSGETYHVEDNSWSGTVTPLDCARAATGWVLAGAKIVGGCCRMGPDHIRAMKASLS